MLISLLVDWGHGRAPITHFVPYKITTDIVLWEVLVKHNEKLMKKLLFLPYSIKPKMSRVAKQVSPVKIQEKKVHNFSVSLGIYWHMSIILYFLSGTIGTIWYWSWKYILSKWFEQKESVYIKIKRRWYISGSLWKLQDHTNV